MTTTPPTSTDQPRRGRGRPTKWTEDLQEEIVEALRAGAYPSTAARAAGISEATFYAWQDRGRTETKRREEAYGTAVLEDLEAEDVTVSTTEDGETTLVAPDEEWDREDPYVRFLEASERAIARSEISLVKGVRKGESGWQGSAWVAERRFRDRWGRTTRTEVTGADGGPLAVATSSLEEIEALAAALLQVPTDED